MTAGDCQMPGLPTDLGPACAFVSLLPVPALVANADGVVLCASPAAEILLGGGGAVRRQCIDHLLPFMTRTPAGRPERGHGSVRDANGAPRDIDVQCAPLTNPASGGELYILHDVTALAELGRIREQFLYNVAHELRGPLAVLDNALEILSSDYTDLTTREFERLLATARHTAARLHALMDDLLSAGAIQAGRFIVRAQPVAVSAMVQDSLDASAAQLDARGQSAQVTLDDGLPLVRADARSIGRVLTNLISNASKYGPDGEPVEIRAVTTGRFVRVTVADRGPGIPPAQRSGLFERFYRARSGDEPPGVGLGLAIAKGIIEAHGGTIDVEHEPEGGTCFWFTLPAA